MSELHPLAIQLRETNERIAESKAAMYAAITRRNELRDQIVKEVMKLLKENPKLSNTALAVLFGYSSETSIRKIRSYIELDDDE